MKFNRSEVKEAIVCESAATTVAELNKQRYRLGYYYL